MLGTDWILTTSYSYGTVIMLILQRRKWAREVKQFPWGHRTKSLGN